MQFDDDSDGKINNRDTIWGSLILWNDNNGDGVSAEIRNISS